MMKKEFLKKYSLPAIIVAVLGGVWLLEADTLAGVGDPTGTLSNVKYEEDLRKMMEDGRYHSAFTKVLDKLEGDYSDAESTRLLQMMQSVYEAIRAKNGAAMSLVNEAEALDVLQAYDALKMAAIKLDSLLEREVQRNYSDDVRSKCKYLVTFKAEVKQNRTYYLSQKVVLPYIWGADAMVEEALGVFNDDEEKIIEAGKYLAQHVHKEWLMQCDEEARMSFAAVYQRIKSDLSDAEWEQLKVLSTLSDSLDPSKSVGADGWWK